MKHYITAALRGVVETQPIAAALAAWAEAHPTEAGQAARMAHARQHMELLAKHVEFENMVEEVSEARANVVGMFEHVARRSGHPSMYGRDDCSPHGIDRPVS